MMNDQQLQEQVMYERALELFTNHVDFRNAIVHSTEHNPQVVELRPRAQIGKQWRVLPASSVGNRYESDGIMLDVPGLTNSELEEVDEDAGEDVYAVADFYAHDKKQQLEDDLAHTLGERNR